MKRTVRIAFLFLTCALASAPVYAQESMDFYDPTKEVVKKENYTFRIDYRLEGGYSQSQQRMTSDTVSALFLHGGRIGVTFDFILPYHFSVQTGLLYTIQYGTSTQHFHSADPETVQTETILNRITEHSMTIPVRIYYNIPLWKQLGMFFYTGPQLMIGLAETDKPLLNLSDATRTWLEANDLHTTTYDRYKARELNRTNIQYGLGGGFQWDVYRLEAGYDFGLNNLIRNSYNPADKMAEWQWHISFAYQFK